MDYNELIKPYSENGRTVAGQIVWLRKQGFTDSEIEHALADTYLEVKNGKTFENGHELDRYLLSVAQAVRLEEVDAVRERMQRRLADLIDKKQEVDPPKETLWKKVKAVFTHEL